MRFPHSFISADKRGRRYALLCRNRSRPPRALLHGPYLLAVSVHVCPRGLMPHELLAGHRMLAFRELPEVFLAYFSAQSPLFGQPAVPFPTYLVTLRVVVLPG